MPDTSPHGSTDRRHSAACRDATEVDGAEHCICLPDEEKPPPTTYELWWCSWCGEPSCEDSDPCQRCGEPIERVPCAAVKHGSTGVEPSAEAVEASFANANSFVGRRALTAAYAIDAPAIHAAGVAEGRAAMRDEIVELRGEGVWHKDGALAQLRQMAQWARDHSCSGFGSEETVRKIARNVDVACDAIEAAFPTTGEKTDG